jgi:peptide/nickel transport system permease protein
VTAPEPVVEVRDLDIRFPGSYGGRAVVEGVSFSLAAGETLGLVGESGSGKTLIGRALLGNLPDTAVAGGTIRVAGVDTLGGSRGDLARLRGGMATAVFQDALVALNPSRTIGGHFADVWAATGKDGDELRRAALETLELVALPDAPRILASYPHELSGGMRQRALIALALLRRPSILVADEPTTALDRLVEHEVLTTLERLQRELGLTMLLISHDLAVVRRLCQRVAVLYAGQLCELGPTAAVLSAQVHRYTAGLVDAAASLRDRRRPLASIPGTVPPPDQFGPGCRFAGRCGYATGACTTERPRVQSAAGEAWCHHPRPADREPEAVAHG